MILNPLQRIQVLESTKKCKTGSLGYFVAQDPISTLNGWEMCIVFTRFGSKGKPRIEPLILRPRMIDYATMKENDQNIMEIAGAYEGIEPRLYPDSRGRIVGKMGDSKLEPVPSDSKDLLNASDEEFTAYVIAMSLFVYKLLARKKVRSLSQTPVLQSQRFVRSGFDIAQITPEMIGYHILYGVQYDINKARLVKHAEDSEASPSFAESYAAQISTEAKKRVILERLRRSIAMSRVALLSYQKSLEFALQNISRKIDDTLKYYRKRKKLLEKVQQDMKDRGWFLDIKNRGR
jgi:hypothetical protein